MGVELLEVRQFMASDLSAIGAASTAYLANNVSDDAFEENDSFQAAYNLGVLTEPKTISSLQLRDDADWFRFEMAGTGTAAHAVSFAFTHAAGDIDVELRNSSGAWLRSSTSTSDSERLSLEALPAGAYYVRVYGYNGANNPSYSMTIAPPVVVADDAYEDNDSMSRAYNLGGVVAPTTISNLQLRDDADWFRFDTAAVGSSQSAVSFAFSHASGDIDVQLYSSSGALLGTSGGATDSERLSLDTLPAGTYYVRVYGFNGARNPSYSMTISPPVVVVDDRYEDNDSISQAANLGSLTAATTVSNLVMRDGQDWFRFRQGGTGTASDYVQVDFRNANGDLDVRLFNASGSLIGQSTSTSDRERISLEGLPAGDYFVQVYGYNGASNGSYSLTVDPGANSFTPTRTLYLNFEGIRLSAATLRGYAGSDWSPQGIDPEGDGIQVSRFLNGRTDRDQIIAGITENLQRDLSVYGIGVQRITGAAVTGVGATTLFFGVNNIATSYGRSAHIAGDIDFGNNNRTDIAFVSDEPYANTASAKLTFADVALHEAGHTFGLFHVNSVVGGVIYNETMGLRYSTPSSEWVRDTSFMDRTFVEYSNHGGGRGSQNAHQTLLANFGLASRNVNASQIVLTDSSVANQFVVTASNAADNISIRQLGVGSIELIVNGQVHVLSGVESVRINTGGDRNDRVTYLNTLTTQVIVDRSVPMISAVLLPKVAVSEATEWNRSDLRAHQDEDRHNLSSDVIVGALAGLRSTERRVPGGSTCQLVESRPGAISTASRDVWFESLERSRTSVIDPEWQGAPRHDERTHAELADAALGQLLGQMHDSFKSSSR